MKIPSLLLLCAVCLPLGADEGMWLFNLFPKDQVKKTYSLRRIGRLFQQASRPRKFHYLQSATGVP